MFARKTITHRRNSQRIESRRFTPNAFNRDAEGYPRPRVPARRRIMPSRICCAVMMLTLGAALGALRIFGLPARSLAVGYSPACRADFSGQTFSQLTARREMSQRKDGAPRLLKRRIRSASDAVCHALQPLESRRLLTSVAITSLADVYARGGNYAALNYGDAPTVQVKKATTANTDNTRDSYLKFDLAGAPAKIT